MLTIGELREIIQHLPSDMAIILSKNTEGSAYAHVAGYGLGYAHEIDRKEGGIYQAVSFLGEEECEEISLPLNCICFGP